MNILTEFHHRWFHFKIFLLEMKRKNRRIYHPIENSAKNHIGKRGDGDYLNQQPRIRFAQNGIFDRFWVSGVRKRIRPAVAELLLKCTFSPVLVFSCGQISVQHQVFTDT